MGVANFGTALSALPITETAANSQLSSNIGSIDDAGADGINLA